MCARRCEISVGLAAWRPDVRADALLTHARAALRTINGDHGPTHLAHAGAADSVAQAPLPQQPAEAGARARLGDAPAFGPAGSA